ncbi:GPP34 family phosphoprotein [Streptomyces sp. NPDC094032]|uniref:GPP34 family phosphoprotein n=1 Tax=Streptomyces sp. NPDC094032 TaxID=3155308 RepID=UPI00331D594E
MSTARDLLTIALDAAPDGSVRQGELSLALAGAELVDLLAEGAVTLDRDVIVPADAIGLDDALLAQGAASLVREAPYEYVDDWLWRRGRDLAGAYVAAFTMEGRLIQERRRWAPLTTGRVVVSDSPDHRRAQERLDAGEPVLVDLATAAGIEAGPTVGTAPEEPGRTDGPERTVLAAVEDAVTELAAVRQRRTIEQAAFDNVWRAP